MNRGPWKGEKEEDQIVKHSFLLLLMLSLLLILTTHLIATDWSSSSSIWCSAGGGSGRGLSCLVTYRRLSKWERRENSEKCTSLECWLVMQSKCPAPVPSSSSSFHFSPLSPSPSSSSSAWALTWASTPAAPNHISFRYSLCLWLFLFQWWCLEFN